MIMLQPGDSMVRRPMPPGIVRTSPGFVPEEMVFSAGKVKAKRGRPKKRERALDDDYDDDDEDHEAPVVTTIVRRKKEKPPADPNGYRFRKYGKKMIGDDARHYYRCTFAGCDCKRHITYLPAGPTIVIIGEHNHPPPTRNGPRDKKKSKMDGGEGSGAAAGSPLYKSLDKFVNDLIIFEEHCEEDDESIEFRLSSKVDHTADGQMWLKKEGEEDGEMVFRCTSQMCNATKSVITDRTGKAVVRYTGPHSHARPLLLARTADERRGSSERSNSGSHGTLQDVYELLALEGDI